MNKLLLTLLAAGMVSTAAIAQVPTLSKTAKTVATPGHRHMNLSKMNIKGFGTAEPVKFNVSDFKQQNTISLNRNTRIDDAKRSHKELSYQVNGDEAQNCYTGTLNLGNISGLTGYGFFQTYSQDMLSRLKGNTISEIQFVAGEATYTNVHVVIIEANYLTGQAAIVWQSETLNNIKTIQNGNLNVNKIPCDYEITGDEQALMIGWFAEKVSTPNLLQATCFVDNTNQGLGFSFFAFINGGLQIGESIANVGWSLDGGKTTTVMAAHILAKTTGNSSLKDNDVMPYKTGIVRSNKAGKGGDLQIEFANLGLDPVSSFEYEFECEDEVQTGKVEMEKPIPFYTGAIFTAKAAVGQSVGSKTGKFTITKVNNVADEYVEADDNVEPYDVVKMETGYKRTPVVEEFTSTGCGYCPYGAAGMKRLHDTYGDEIVLIAAHSNFSQQLLDPMHDNDYNNVAGLLGVTGFPSAFINRQYSGHPYFDAVPTVEKIVTSDVCEADMTIEVGKAPVNKAVKTIDVTTTLNFDFDVKAGDYSMVYALTEDGLTGYNQLTYLPDQVDAAMKELPNLTREQVIEAMAEGDPYLVEVLSDGTKQGSNYWSQPTFDHVSRGVTNADGKTPDNLPAATKNTPIEVKAKVNIPNTVVSRKNLKVAAMLIDNKTGLIVTGRQAATGTKSTASAIDEVTNAAAEISVADGAFVVKADKAEAAVYSVDGKLVSSATVNGVASLPTFGKGVFVITVKANGKVYTEKAVF